MPPITFSYYESPDLPKLDLNESISGVTQLALPHGDHTATTEITYLGSAEGGKFERYAVEHQVERKREAIFRQERTKHFIEVRRFYAYYSRDDEHFFVQAGKKDSRGMFDRLKKAEPPIVGTVQPVDLHRLSDLGTTTGAWFGNLKIADVNTAALFGPSGVLDSEDWERYSESGEIAMVYMKIVGPDDEVRPVQLTRDRLVVLGIDEGEGANLEFVSTLQAAIDKELKKD